MHRILVVYVLSAALVMAIAYAFAVLPRARRPSFIVCAWLLALGLVYAIDAAVLWMADAGFLRVATSAFISVGAAMLMVPKNRNRALSTVGGFVIGLGVVGLLLS